MLGALFGPKLTAEQKTIKTWIRLKLGYVPKDLKLFEQALTHSSAISEGNKEAFIAKSNERMEFLGDAVLASVMAEKLYLRYPQEGEGFLTRFRARLVQRETLNKLANDLELHRVVKMRVEDRKASSVTGNALEALLGAIYLERGYEATAKVVGDLFGKHLDIEKLAKTDNDKKSRLLEWGQKRKKNVEFKLKEEKKEDGARTFRAEVFIDGKMRGFGLGRSKKRAEQEAAKYALRKLQNRRRKPKRQAV